MLNLISLSETMLRSLYSFHYLTDALDVRDEEERTFCTENGPGKFSVISTSQARFGLS
jgi:hypothetical protein